MSEYHAISPDRQSCQIANTKSILRYKKIRYSILRYKKYIDMSVYRPISSRDILTRTMMSEKPGQVAVPKIDRASISAVEVSSLADS